MDFKTISNIRNKDDFLDFIKNYVVSTDNHIKLNEYLESVMSWVEDMDGFYTNTGYKQPDAIDWSFIATLFYVGKIYE